MGHEAWVLPYTTVPQNLNLPKIQTQGVTQLEEPRDRNSKASSWLCSCKDGLWSSIGYADSDLDCEI